MYHPTDSIAHTFLIPVVEHWLEREIAQWVHHEGSIRRPFAPRSCALTTELDNLTIKSMYVYVCICMYVSVCGCVGVYACMYIYING